MFPCLSFALPTNIQTPSLHSRSRTSKTKVQTPPRRRELNPGPITCTFRHANRTARPFSNGSPPRQTDIKEWSNDEAGSEWSEFGGKQNAKKDLRRFVPILAGTFHLVCLFLHSLLIHWPQFDEVIHCEGKFKKANLVGVFFQVFITNANINVPIVVDRNLPLLYC